MTEVAELHKWQSLCA